jgi:hypothetical protein
LRPEVRRPVPYAQFVPPSDRRYSVTGYTAIAHLAQLTSTDTVFLSRVHNWLIATWVLSLATQLGATPLIGYQFWKSIPWNFQGIRASRLSVLWILVESGALYSVTTLFLLGFSSTNTGAIFAASLGQISVRVPASFSPSFVSSRDVLLQALVPTLIIVRAGLKSSASSSSSFTPAKGSINNPYYPSAPPRPSIRDIESGSGEEDDTMVVHIGKATEIHLDDMIVGIVNRPGARSGAMIIEFSKLRSRVGALSRFSEGRYIKGTKAMNCIAPKYLKNLVA